MRIWHLNVGNHAGRVDGVAMMSTRLAGAQAAAGHEVHLWVVTSAEHREDVRRATAPAVRLSVHDTARRSLSSLRVGLDDPELRPDVIHVHSVFRPVHAVVALLARRRGVPVVQTPHAGVDPTLLRRDRQRKWVYRWLVERWTLRSAAAVIALQNIEADDIRAFSGRRTPIDVVANAVDETALDHPRWRPPASGAPPVALMLSRYDVLQKGLDRVAAMGRARPDLEFHIHGSQDKNDHDRFDQLRAAAPSNVRFLPPIYDQEKFAALTGATVFLLPSRAEGVSLALTEAMTLGVPCAVSSFVDRSLGLGEVGAALVLDDDPEVAAEQLAELVVDREALVHLSDRAAELASERFDPTRVASAHLSIYDRVTSR